MRVAFPYDFEEPTCTDTRRWPNVLIATDMCFFHVNVDLLLIMARVFDDDLRDAVRGVWPRDAEGAHEDEVTLMNTLDAAIDEQDRRRNTPVRPRQPMPGTRVRVDE